MRFEHGETPVYSLDRVSCSGRQRISPAVRSMRLTPTRYQALIRQYQSEIAASITLEQGKTHADAKGDVFRGLQVVDTACAIPTLLKGESVEVARDMDTTSIREPLGVTGAICPFNFPAMSKLCSTEVRSGHHR